MNLQAAEVASGTRPWSWLLLIPGVGYARAGRRTSALLVVVASVAALAIIAIQQDRVWNGLISLVLSIFLWIANPRMGDILIRAELVECWIASLAVFTIPVVGSWLGARSALRPDVQRSIHELGQWGLAWREFRRHRIPMFGLLLIAVLYAAAILCPFLAPHPPNSFRDGMVTQFRAPMSRVPALVFKTVRQHRPEITGRGEQINGASLLGALNEANASLVTHQFDRLMFIDGFHIEAADVVATVGKDIVRIPMSELAGADPSAFTTSILFPLGTDTYGRDLLSRILYGSRISLALGLIAVALSVTLGTLAGLTAGYFGRWADSILMRLVDVLLAFPSLFLILIIIAIFDVIPVPRILLVVSVLGLTSWMGVARLVRGEVLSLREREFVVAAQAIGLGSMRILFRHILPNTLSPIIVNATLRIGGIILVEAALSYLNLGVQQPTASWGNIIFEGKDVLSGAWWIATFPGFAIVLTVVSFNLVGDGLRDAFDPLIHKQGS